MVQHTACTNPLLFPSSVKGDRNERYELMVAFEAGKSGALWEAFHPPSGELLSDQSADVHCFLQPWPDGKALRIGLGKGKRHDIYTHRHTHSHTLTSPILSTSFSLQSNHELKETEHGAGTMGAALIKSIISHHTSNKPRGCAGNKLFLNNFLFFDNYTH